jgi:hypothetical protein
MTINFAHFWQFFPALDKSCIRDNFIVRRDWQKLRHGGLPAGTVYRLKYRDPYRRTAPPTLSAHTRRAVMFKPPGDFNHDKFNWTMA